MTEEKRIEISLLVAAKYNRKFYMPGEKVLILPSEVESLIKDGVIRQEDVPEIDEVDKPLEKMKVDELKAYAFEHAIDLGDASKKEEVLAAILKAGDPNGGVS
ncbi:hypothetical protein [Paenibacillus sp. FSL H7-0323]|uniref:hypothetical protein n=1 Tax=Paenibacillus sp. FSL H7-0323 TaxID=2921433 RepID=UPI0030F72271